MGFVPRAGQPGRRKKLSGRVYLGMIGMADTMPYEFWRWELVQETGWTLDQVDALSVKDWNDWLHIRDGKAKARATMRNKNNRSR